MTAKWVDVSLQRMEVLLDRLEGDVRLASEIVDGGRPGDAGMTLELVRAVTVPAIRREYERLRREPPAEPAPVGCE